jgi:putative salt-induced outer membrane protein YdiY
VRARWSPKRCPLPLLLIGLQLVHFEANLLADVVRLRTGERVIGKLVSEDQEKVIFESVGLGRLEIPRGRIEKIEQDTLPDAPDTPTIVAPKLTLRADTSPADPRSGLWTPSPPADNRFDWIQLKSGEWLKGRMKSLQDEKLEFDSEELDLHEFDWEDIRTVRLPGLNSIWLGDETITGRLIITTNEVRVFGVTTNTYRRSDLVAVTPTGKRERNNWSSKITAGLTLSSGNTKQLDYNAKLEIDRRTPSTHLSLDYLGNVGRIDGTETLNNHRINAEFDYFLSRRLFLLLPFVEYYKDPLQNLDHRLTLGAGVGYDFIKNRRVEWNVTAGPAYQRNWYTSVEPGVNDHPGALALALGSRLEIEVTKRVDFVTELRSQVTSKEVGETTHHGVVTLEFEIHKRLDLDISFIWDRVSNPKPDADGVTPLRDDFRLIVGLGIDF